MFEFYFTAQHLTKMTLKKISCCPIYLLTVFWIEYDVFSRDLIAMGGCRWPGTSCKPTQRYFESVCEEVSVKLVALIKNYHHRRLIHHHNNSSKISRFVCLLFFQQSRRDTFYCHNYI